MDGDHWTFTMVTPEAVVGGYLDLVLGCIQAQGFEIRACRLLALDYPRLGRMYSHRDEAPAYSGRRIELPPWVMTPLYSISPAVILVMRRDAGDACAAMLECKGATRPESAAPGTVRAAGENYVFNFVHCPDDPESAAVELATLVGARDAAGLRALASASGRGLESVVGVDPLRLCMPAFSGWQAISFPAVASRIRCRVAQRLAALVHSDTAAVALLREAQVDMVRERVQLDATPTVRGRFRIGQEVDRTSQPRLTAAAVAAGDTLTAAGLRALSALYDLDGPRDVAAIRAMGEGGVYLSELERVTLDAHSYTWWRDVESTPV